MRFNPFRFSLAILFILFTFPLLAIADPDKPEASKTGDGVPKTLIGEVAINPPSFNPSMKQQAEISYKLSRDARTTIRIFDPDGGRIRTLIDNAEEMAGNRKAVWDGKDDVGQIVPDEAYGFTIQATDAEGTTETYMPPPSDWERFDTADAKISREANAIVFRLSHPCRTRIQIGVENGPLLYAPLDWEPKIAGEILVHWDGWDENRAVNIWKLPDSKMVITNMKLPEHTMITYGNKETDYFQYRLSKPGSHTALERQQRGESIPVTAPAPLSTMLSPELKVSFPMTEKFTPEGLPVLRGKALVRIEVKNPILVSQTQYELIFFIDGAFHSEEPLGITPYNWVWNLSNVEKGEHLLTVNLVSFNDQYAAFSQRIQVTK